MTKEILAFDAETHRFKDENGNLHVINCHLTKAQVRPYWGYEIPDYIRLRLDPKRVYRGYCSPEELSKPETIKSVNGIPIQLNHHPDYASNPALETRIGSTGTDGVWNAPYLDNSLHFQSEDAIKRIEDESMRELSLSYRYTPDFTPGTTPDGEDYDFVMRNISANHVALVESGRAGRDVLVADSALKVNDMTEEIDAKKVPAGSAAPDGEKDTAPTATTPAAHDGEPAVEKKEVDYAKAIKEAAEAIVNLHAANASGDVVDKDDEDDEIADDDGEGVSPVKPDAPGGEDDVIAQALEKVGLSDAAPEIKKAFIAGLKFTPDQENSAQDEDEGLDDEADKPACVDDDDDDDGKKGILGQDAAIKLCKAVEARMNAKFKAMREVEPSLGQVRFEAYDSAGAIYLAALKQEGIPTKGLTKASARAAYQIFAAMKRKSGSGRALANDAEIRKGPRSAVDKILANIHEV